MACSSLHFRGLSLPRSRDSGFMPLNPTTPARYMQQFSIFDALVPYQPAAEVTPSNSSRATEDELDHKINSQIDSVIAAKGRGPLQQG